MHYQKDLLRSGIRQARQGGFCVQSHSGSVTLCTGGMACCLLRVSLQ
jgi:hypothetical protein